MRSGEKSQYGGVVIPEAVADELAFSHVALPAWIRTMVMRNKRVVEDL